MDNHFRPLRAVAFVLLTLGLLAFTYFLVLRVDLGGSTRVTIRFSSVGTIQAGSPVRQSGVKVGTVSKVALAQDERGFVDVELSLYQGSVVRTDDSVSIVTGGLLGDQYIDIVAGSSDAPISDPSVPMKGQGGLDLKVLVDGGGDLIKDLGLSSRAIASFLARHADSLDRIVADAERGVKHAADAAERADRLLAKAEGSFDPAAADARAAVASLKQTAEALQGMVNSLSAPGGTAALLGSPATAQAASETLQNLQATSRSLKTVTEALEAALK